MNLANDPRFVEFARAVVEHFGRNLAREFLSPLPSVYLREPYAVLDLLRDAGIPAEDIDGWLVAAQAPRP